MKVQDFMTPQVRTCTPDSTVQEAARIMAEVNTGIVPIVSGTKLVGVVTDRDIVLRCVTKGKDGNTRVGECMTQNVITCTPDMDAHDAADLMADRQIRRLPVVQGERLVGIVALGDMATVEIHIDEAGSALSSISDPARPEPHLP